MLGIGWSVVVVLLLGQAPAVKVEGELARIQGRWSMVAAEFNGDKIEADLIKSASLLIEGDSYTAKLNDRSIASTIKLDGSKSPKTIDFTYVDGPQIGETIPGIYKLDGETLTICRPLRSEDPRPTELTSPADAGRILVVWKRVKDEAGSNPAAKAQP